MGPIVCAETSRHNYRSALRNIPEARRSSVDISLSADGHQNDVYLRISPRYYLHTDLIQDTTACFKILAHKQEGDAETYFIYLVHLKEFSAQRSSISERSF